MIKINTTGSNLTVDGLSLEGAGVTYISGAVNLKTSGNDRYSFCQWYYEKEDGTADKDRPIPQSAINVPYGYDFLAKTYNPDTGQWEDTYAENRGGFTGVNGDIYNANQIHIQLLVVSNPLLMGKTSITEI